MSKIRISELAKKIGVSNKEVLAALSSIGITDKKHSSSIDLDSAEKIEALCREKQKSAPPAKQTGVTAGSATVIGVSASAAATATTGATGTAGSAGTAATGATSACTAASGSTREG